jgi:hypothetical protein
MPMSLKIKFPLGMNTPDNVNTLQETIIPYFSHLGVDIFAYNFNHVNPDHMICYRGPLNRKAEKFLEHLRDEGLQIEVNEYQPPSLD